MSKTPVQYKLPNIFSDYIETPQLDQWSKYCKSTPYGILIGALTGDVSPQIIDSVNNDTIESLSVLELPSRHQEIDSEATVSLT